jgi:hypothetical protein
MQNEENTDEVQVEQKENQTAAAEEAATEETPIEETPEAKLAKAEAEAAKYRRLFEKSQKPPQGTTPAKAPQPASPQSVEETVLLANGMDEELLTKLKAVARVEGIGSLIKAQTNPIFIAVKEKFEKEKKQQEASLGASRGAGAVKAEKSFNSPGLSRDEHKKMFQSAL